MDIASVVKAEGSLYMTVTLTNGNALFVPAIESNRHYKEIKEKVEAGDLTIDLPTDSST